MPSGVSRFAVAYRAFGISSVSAGVPVGLALGAIYHDKTGVIKANRCGYCTAQHGIRLIKDGLASSVAFPASLAKGVFGGSRIAGRVVKYVDPGKSTESESSCQGHTR